MSEIVRQIGQKIAEQSITQEQTPEAKVPDEKAVAQFEKAMEGEQTPISQSQDIQINTSQVKNEPETLGDQILHGIEKLRQEHEAQTERVNELLENKEGKPLSVQDALRLQFELVQINFQQDIVSKSADKSSQAIQSMLRNQ